MGGCGSPWLRRFSFGLGSTDSWLASAPTRWAAAGLLGYAGFRQVWARQSPAWAVPWLGGRRRSSLVTQVFVWFRVGSPSRGHFPGLPGSGGSPGLRRLSSGLGSAVPCLGSSLARRAAAVLLGHAGFSSGSGSAVPRGGGSLATWVAADLLGYAGLVRFGLHRLAWAASWLGPRRRFPLTKQVLVWFGPGSTASGQVPAQVGGGGPP